MYLQRAGRINEAWAEIERLLKEGYPNQSTEPEFMAHDHATIYHKMRIFLQREGKIEHAIVYEIFSYLSRLLAHHLQGRKEDFDYATSYRFYEEPFARLLRKIDKEDVLGKLKELVESIQRRIPDLDFDEIKKQIFTTLCFELRGDFVLRNRHTHKNSSKSVRATVTSANGKELLPHKEHTKLQKTMGNKIFIHGVKYTFKNVKQVPKWNNYFPDISYATTSQKRFYNRWLRNFQKYKILDVKGNLGYIFVYLYAIIDQFQEDKQIDTLIHKFSIIKQAYAEYEKIEDYLHSWIYEAYLYLGEYDGAWEYLKKKAGGGGGLSSIINIRAKCHNTSIDGYDLLVSLGSDHGLTRFGVAKRKQIVNLASIYFENYHKTHGKNFVEHFVRRFNFVNLKEEDFAELRKFFANEKEFLFWKKIYNDNRTRYPYFYATQYFNNTIQEEAIPSIITVAITNVMKRILRECENTVREESELPKVGEGWYSETELFHRICRTFPQEIIIHHGRPDWLHPQHLDIFLPERRIAVEYQGKQHLNPVEYYGGEKAFKQQQKRDARKKRLCERNNCVLIYVQEGYDFKVLKQHIQNLLVSSNGSKNRTI